MGIIVTSSFWLLNCELWPYCFFPYFSKIPTLVAGKVHSWLIFFNLLQPKVKYLLLFFFEPCHFKYKSVGNKEWKSEVSFSTLSPIQPRMLYFALQKILQICSLYAVLKKFATTLDMKNRQVCLCLCPLAVTNTSTAIVSYSCNPKTAADGAYRLRM